VDEEQTDHKDPIGDTRKIADDVHPDLALVDAIAREAVKFAVRL
jgi:hypothetical protein